MSVLNRCLACVASGSVWFPSKERPRSKKWNVCPPPRSFTYSRHFSRGLWPSFLFLCSETARKRLPRRLRDVRLMESRIKGVKKGRGQLKVSALQRSSSYRGVRSFWRVFVFATTYMKAVNIDICLRHHATNQPHNKWTRPLPQRHDCQKLYVFIAYMESVKQKCRAIYLLPIADIISFAEKENERPKKRLFPWLNHVINFR